MGTINCACINGMPVFSEVELGELVGVLLDEVGDAPQDLGPLTPGQSGPDTGLVRRLRAGDGVVDRVLPAVRELGDLLFSHGVDDRDDVAGAGSLAEFVQYSLQHN